MTRSFELIWREDRNPRIPRAPWVVEPQPFRLPLVVSDLSYAKSLADANASGSSGGGGFKRNIPAPTPEQARNAGIGLATVALIARAIILLPVGI